MTQELLFGRDDTLPLPTEDGDRILDDARAEIADKAWRGTICPCCGQKAKVYKRKLHAEMAAFLCRLVVKAGADLEWVHTRDVLLGGHVTQKASTDGSYLVHWGLVEARGVKPDDPGTGMYRPTKKGVDFVMRRINVPSHIIMFNNIFLGFGSRRRTTVEASLKDYFSYSELMRGE